MRDQPGVIVVSFNYRLNVFGYPNSDALIDKNPGLRDVRAGTIPPSVHHEMNY